MHALHRFADWSRLDEPRFGAIRAAFLLAGLFVALAIALSLAGDASGLAGIGQLILWRDAN